MKFKILDDSRDDLWAAELDWMTYGRQKAKLKDLLFFHFENYKSNGIRVRELQRDALISYFPYKTAKS